MDRKLQRRMTEVLERDEYTCQNCGANTNLDAAHIHSRSSRPDLAYDTRNGIALCRRGHSYFHSVPKAFEKFLRVWYAGFTNPTASVDCLPGAHRHSQDRRFTDAKQNRLQRDGQLHFSDESAASVNERAANLSRYPLLSKHAPRSSSVITPQPLGFRYAHTTPKGY